MSQRRLSASVAFLSLATAASAHAGERVFYVDPSRPPGGTGASWESAFNNLQSAFDQLPLIDPQQVRQHDIVIKIAQGTYRADQHRPSAFQMGGFTTSGAVLFIQGAYGGFNSPTPDARDFVATPTILSGDVLGDDGPNFSNRGDNCQTVLATMEYGLWLPNPPWISIDGLTIQGGHSATARPSGVFVASDGASGHHPFSRTTSCSFSNCTIRDNYGSAIATHEFAVNALNLWLTDCVLSENRTLYDGAAIRTAAYQSVRASRCQFIDNHALNGGAIASDDYINFHACLFAGNTASANGGAISQTSDLWYGSFLTSCLFTNNSAGRTGGALSVNLVHVVHCTVAHNTASWGGGAFFDNSPSLNASVFALNSATSSGDQFAGNGPIPQMRFVAVPGASSDIYFPFSAVQPRVGFELLQYAPAFSSPLGADGMASTWLDNNYRLDPRSPLIDAVYTENPHRDFDWNPGPIEGIAGRGLRLDPGCYELQTTLCAADMDADGGVTVDDIVLFLAAFEQGLPPADLANGNFAQPLPSPDGGVTVDDLLFFLARFEQGC